MSYIEANPTFMQSLIITDHDGGSADEFPGILDLPQPSWVALNPHTRAGHIVYALARSRQQHTRVAVKALEAAPTEADRRAEETPSARPRSFTGAPDDEDDSPALASPAHESGLRRWARTLFRG